MITLGPELTFGAAGQGRAWLGESWSHDADAAWSLGTTATLDLPTPAGPGDLFVELELEPCVAPPAIPTQPLRIEVARETVLARALAGPATLRLALPPSPPAAGRVTLRLHHPAPLCPREAGLGEDGRRLGMRLTRARALRRAPTQEASGPYALAGAWRFGFGGTGEEVLGEGWGPPEPGHIWALGRRSTLRIPHGTASPHVLLLELWPFTAPELPRQRFMAGVDGRLAASFAADRLMVIALDLPAPEAGDAWQIGFDNLDAAGTRGFGQHPDGRDRAFMLLRAWLIRRTPLAPPSPAAAPPPDPATLFARFISAGHACDFGLLQREAGAAHLELLHAGISTPGLVRGLADGFWHLGRPDRLEIAERETEPNIWFTDRTYDLVVPTGVPRGSAAAAEALPKLARSLPYLRRRFLEDLAGGAKILLLRRPEPLLPSEVHAVLAAMLLHGDATLLWAVQDGTIPPGQARRLGPRLLQGGLDGPGGPASPTCWQAMLRAAAALAA